MPRDGRPLKFDGSNYAYWKALMRAYLRAIDERIWLSVVNGYTEPVLTINDVVVPKPIQQWDKLDFEKKNWNNKALSIIFNGITCDEFRRISICETAKEAWDILEVTHEGTDLVKNSKLQRLTTTFETLRMDEGETFDAFYAKLSDVVNSCFYLGKKLSQSEIVRKILRSLPDRFQPKVTAIEESKDIDLIKVEQLVGNLQTYESNLNLDFVKLTGIALKSSKIDLEDSDSDSDIDPKVMAFMVKNFKKSLKNKKKGITIKDNSQKNKGNENLRIGSNNEKKVGKGQSQHGQCYKYDGDCDDFHAFTTSLCSHESNDKSDNDVDERVIHDSDNEEINDLQEAYDKLYQVCTKWAGENFKLTKRVNLLVEEKEKLGRDLSEAIEKSHVIEKVKDDLSNEYKTLMGINSKLDRELDVNLNENKSLKIKVVELELKLKETDMTFKKLNAGSKSLDDMLSFQKIASDRTGLGYQGSTSMSQKTVGKIIFVKAKTVDLSPQKESKVKFVPTPPKAKEINVHPKKTNTTNVEVKSFKFIPTCHHCGKIGHIRPNCFKLNRMHNSVKFYKPICHNCGVIGHIRPNCAKLRNNKVNVIPKVEKIVRPKIKTIWVRKSDLHAYDMEYDTLDDSVESRDFGLAL